MIADVNKEYSLFLMLTFPSGFHCQHSEREQKKELNPIFSWLASMKDGTTGNLFCSMHYSWFIL